MGMAVFGDQLTQPRGMLEVAAETPGEKRSMVSERSRSPGPLSWA